MPHLKNINPIFYEKTKEGETFYDVYARLVKDRVIFLSEVIDAETASTIISLLFLLDREDQEEPISLWINSPGGEVDSFFAIYDMMQLIKSPIKTICIGSASSAAAILMAAGSSGLRYITPNSHVMIHQVRAEDIGGTGTEIEIEANEVKKIKNRLNDILARHCGKTISKIRRDCEHDKYLDAKGAVEYGIVDHILGPTKKRPELVVRKKKAAANPEEKE